MKNKGLITLIVASIIIISAALSVVILKKPGKENPEVYSIPLADDTNATAEMVRSLAESLNEFSFDFFNQIINHESGNVFFSPYSIFVALSMAYEGARGNTAFEMENVLKFRQNDSVALGSFGRIYNLLNQNQDGYKISTANAFWANENYVFKKHYLKLLENFYMAEAHELDFSKNVEAAEIISSWIEEKTNDKIKDMIKPDMLSDLTKLVLTNAIYFKGLWAQSFDPDNTYETDFSLISNDKVKVDMMRSDSETTYNYTENEDLKFLKLNYKSNNLSMIIVLPKENNITTAELQMSPQNLSNWNLDFNETDVNVEIPKFKFERKYDLVKYLVDMGISDAFMGGIADFSGMDGTNSLFIGKAIHQSFIEVNEEGTEAAAATAIIMELSAMPDTKDFIADHPFIFLIQHEETGAILFMGKVANPAE